MRDLSAIEEFIRDEVLNIDLVEASSFLAEQPLLRPGLAEHSRLALKRFLDLPPMRRADPEVFPPIFALGQRAVAAEAAEAMTRALLVHSGLEPISTFGRERPKFLRLAHSSGKVLKSQDGGWYDVSGEVLQAFGDHFVYWPYPDLFQDILPEQHYPHCIDSMIDRAGATSTLTCALDLLHQFSPALSKVFRAGVKNIIVLPNRKAPRYSFSCRTAYLGGIFIDLNRSAASVAEDLMHETVHQSLWSQWCARGVQVPSNCQVYSPVTNRWRPADSMIHAFVIYQLAIAFHCCLPSEEVREHRIKILRESIPIIRQQLPLEASPEIKRLVSRTDELVGSFQARTNHRRIGR